jgi:hypothetical protein
VIKIEAPNARVLQAGDGAMLPGGEDKSYNRCSTTLNHGKRGMSLDGCPGGREHLPAARGEGRWSFRTSRPG